MAVVINTNYSATVAANNLATSNTSLQRSLNRLSSGSKIVSPADDAGGLAVSMKLSAASKRQAALNNNIGNAVSFLQTQDGALKVTGKILDRMSELKTLYEDKTKNDTDKDNYATEFTALAAQLKAITDEKFNGTALFASTGTTVYTTDELSTSSSVTMAGRELSSSSTGVGLLMTGGASAALSSVSLSNITSAIQSVATFRAANGAEQSRMGFASELLTVNKANLESANSRIVDVDVADESTQLARWNVLVQSGTAMLSQANQSSQTALRLLQ